MKRANTHRVAGRDDQIGFRCPSKLKARIIGLIDQLEGRKDLTDVMNDVLPDVELRLQAELRQRDKQRQAVFA